MTTQELQSIIYAFQATPHGPDIMIKLVLMRMCMGPKFHPMLKMYQGLQSIINTMGKTSPVLFVAVEKEPVFLCKYVLIQEKAPIKMKTGVLYL